MDTHSLCTNTIKGLAMDAVQAANSGHPGMPMGTADVATVLWTRFLKHDPADPAWADRDRFVLSAGHGSMLIYSLLHLSGYDLSLDDLKSFRQMGSRTPGHPEYGHTAGVETTTGPLGQGVATAVGMAMAERTLRETFGAELCDHYTWVIAGDGCLMEGISSEAASLAGHLGLGRLICIYDDNEISIDGSTDISFTEDRAARFRAYGWHVVQIDGHDPAAIEVALAESKAITDRPSLICARTIIGKDCPIEGTSQTHGAALGHEYIRATKLKLGMDPNATFVVPEGATAAFRAHDGPARRDAWESRLDAHPRRAEFDTWLATDGDALVEQVQWPSFEQGSKLATRKSSAACLKAISTAAPWVIGGSADLAGSNGTNIGSEALDRHSFAGRQTIHFGVREHAMGAICNGLALHGGVLPYCATFLIFHQYMRPAVRLAALMGQRVPYIYTHDSIFLGEDGPTHQPVEVLLEMRAIPNLRVIRPADANESLDAWKLALLNDGGPTALVLTRQGLPVLPVPPDGAVARGAYVLQDVNAPDVVLVGTGSEVALCVQAAKLLAADGIGVRVVSMPCVEAFLEQDDAYRSSVLPTGVRRVSVEAGVTLGWSRIVGDTGVSIGIDSFGASAPASELAEHFGFTPANVAAKAKALIGR